MKQYAMIFIMLGVLVAVQMPTGAQPLAKFDFNEGSGNTTTDSVSGLVGTLGLTNPPDVSGAVVVNDDNPAGAANDKSMQFTGVDGLSAAGEQAAFADLIQNPLTVEAWVKVDQYAQTWEDIFRIGNSLKLGFNNGNIVWTTLGVYDWLSQVPVPAGEWHHIAVTWVPGDIAVFYLDGEEANVLGHTGLARALQNNLLSIGSSHTASSILIGSIDRLRIHNTILEPAQLDSVANAPKPVNANTVIAYDFNGGLPAQNQGSFTLQPTAQILESQYANSRPEFRTDTPTGQAGDYSLYFNGVGARVYVPDPDFKIALDVTWNFTLEAYIKFDDLPGARSMILAYGVPGAGGYSFSVTNNRNLFATTYGIKDFNEAVDAVIPDTNWHHAAVVLDSDNGQMRFYVDGELKNTVDYTGGVNSTTGNYLFIGMEGTETAPGNLYKGYIDRIRIYDTVLTPNQFDIVTPVNVDSWMMF